MIGGIDTIVPHPWNETNSKVFESALKREWPNFTVRMYDDKDIFYHYDSAAEIEIDRVGVEDHLQDKLIYVVPGDNEFTVVHGKGVVKLVNLLIQNIEAYKHWQTKWGDYPMPIFHCHKCGKEFNMAVDRAHTILCQGKNETA